MSRITFPWCLLGDWNVEPHELRDAGFLEKLGRALIWTPSDTRSTCTLSPFRLLDYAVISPSFQVLARSMTAIHDLPWHAHLGLEITLSHEAKTFQCQELPVPRRFVQAMAENKKSDLSSKRAKRKAAFQHRFSKWQERPAAGPTADEDQDPSEPLLCSLPNEARDDIWHTFHSLSDSDEPSAPLGARMLWAAAGADGRTRWRSISAWTCASPAAAMAGIHRPQSPSPHAQCLVGPLWTAPALAPCARLRLVRAVAKHLLLFLTCAQRNHGSQQQQAAFAALRARSKAVHYTDNMKPEDEALWSHHLSDIFSVSPPVPWGMYREATGRTQHVRSSAISEARRGIDGWVRQHAEKGNKRLHARARGDTPPMVEFQVDGKSTSDPAQILASKRQLWSGYQRRQ